jgi:ubiquinone/menaquinone biosynthesis C-methylase UbiE
VKSKLNQFNKIAVVYDVLASIFFGRSIRKAQQCFLRELPHAGNILILGGGSGWILNAVMKTSPHCSVWYVEASDVMISKAKKYLSMTGNIHFIHGTENSLSPDVKYDGVITNFYLDLFSHSSLSRALNQIHGVTNKECTWLVTDFVNNSWWQQCLLWLMYRFFRITCQIEANSLPQWEEELNRLGLDQTQCRSFYGGFICSSVYRYAWPLAN